MMRCRFLTDAAYAVHCCGKSQPSIGTGLFGLGAAGCEAVTGNVLFTSYKLVSSPRSRRTIAKPRFPCRLKQTPVIFLNNFGHY